MPCNTWFAGVAGLLFREHHSLKGRSLMAASRRFDPWSPPRPFPVHRWQRQRFAFRVSVSPTTPRPQPLDAEQRRDLELRLLVSQLPAAVQAAFFSTLRWEAKRRAPWSQERCAAGKGWLAQPRFPDTTLATSGVGWLRAMVIAECELGLTTIQTPLAWLMRPARNHSLALRAARLGQLTTALESCLPADALAQEVEQALTALRR
jgi:hypothetical protein